MNPSFETRSVSLTSAVCTLDLAGGLARARLTGAGRVVSAQLEPALLHPVAAAL